MKKNIVKRVIASASAFFAASAMTALNTYAVTSSPTINTLPAHIVEEPQTTQEISVNKEIVLFNVDGSDILEPNITYTYEVTSANAENAEIKTYSSDDIEVRDGKSIVKDNAIPITVKVREGIIGAVISSDIETPAESDKVTVNAVFGEDNETKYPANKESTTKVDFSRKISKDITFTIDAAKIYDTNGDGKQDNGPGIYRYKISDVTDEATFEKAGVKDGSASNDILLDVYTKYNENSDGLVVYGYVLLKSGTDGEDTSIEYHSGEDETAKITGYDVSTEENFNSGSDVQPADIGLDSYYTYNVEVSKKVTGSLADTQHNFPFTLTLENAKTSLTDFYYVITKDGNALDEKITSLSENGTWTLDGNTASTDLRLQNGDKILITGLPKNTKINVSEKNDTNDTYSVSATGNNEELVITSDNAIGTKLSVAGGKTAELRESFAVENSESADKIEIINSMKDISVTGLIFNIAPFIFITAAGIALTAIFMRNKKNNNSENII